MTIALKKAAGISLFVLLLLSVALLLVPAVWLDIKSYNDILLFVTGKLGRPDLYNTFKNFIFSEARYGIVYRLHFALYPLVVLLWFLIIWKREKILRSIENVASYFSIGFRTVFRFYQSLNRQQKVLLFAITAAYFILSFWKLLNRDITYDEAWNYNYFIDKPFYFPFLLFNTYPFYHFLASVCNHLPGDPVIICRLIPAISGWLFLLVVFYAFSKWYSKTTALLIVFVIMATPMFALYSIMAKGITLSLLFCSIQFYCTIQLAKKFKQALFAVFFIASFFAIISMPTTALFFAGCVVFLLLNAFMHRDKKTLKKIVVGTATLFFIAAFFYLPALFSLYNLAIVSDAIFRRSNPLVSFFSEISQVLWGNQFVFAVLVGIGMLLFFFKARRPMISTAIMIISTVAICFYFRQFPDRSLAFILLPLLVIIAELLQLTTPYFKPVSTKAIFILLVIISSGFFQWKNASSFVYPTDEDKTFSHRISQWMLSKNIGTCYVQHPQFWVHFPAIEYYYGRQHKNWQMHNGNQNSARYRSYDGSVYYDCIVTDSLHQNMAGKDYHLQWKEQGVYFYSR